MLRYYIFLFSVNKLFNPNFFHEKQLTYFRKLDFFYIFLYTKII